MSPFSVTLQHVPDRELGPLLIRLAEAGFRNPVIEPVAADGGPEAATVAALGPTADLALDWQLVREREGASYQWPEERDSVFALPRLRRHDTRRGGRPHRSRRDGPQEQSGAATGSTSSRS